MNGEYMKCLFAELKFVGAALLTFFLLLGGANGICNAEGQALEQLLDLLRKNGAISSEQATKIKATLAQEQKALSDREQALTKRERAVLQREQALAGKEASQPGQDDVDRQAGSQSALPAPNGGTDAEQVKAEVEKPARQVSDGVKGFPLEAVFDDGFFLRSREKGLFELQIGGLLQAEYRYYDYGGNADPRKNKFDIRRARLLLAGKFYERFSYKFQYEFQGADSRKLLDAYVDARILPFISLRMGQFKEPFSLEQDTSSKNIVFAERDMGYYLTPRRDVGFMAHASFWKDRIYYGVGIFNGDGVDDTAGGNSDSPEITGRIVYAPFRNMGFPLVDGLHVGGSYSYAKADSANVKVAVKTGGLTTFFDVSSSAKSNPIRDVDARTRYGAELAWTYGPLLLWGEYINLQFSDVETSNSKFDINLTDYYGALMWMVTGEEPAVRKGVIQGIRPRRNLFQGGWGALGLAFRCDHFDGGDSAYEYLVEAGTSVREATAYTIGINWYLNPYIRVLLNATRTNFDRPLLIETDSITGETIYSDREDVLTGRVQLQF